MKNWHLGGVWVQSWGMFGEEIRILRGFGGKTGILGDVWWEKWYFGGYMVGKLGF